MLNEKETNKSTSATKLRLKRTSKKMLHPITGRLIDTKKERIHRKESKERRKYMLKD